MIIGLELLHTWLASSNHCSSPLVLTIFLENNLATEERSYQKKKKKKKKKRKKRKKKKCLL